MKKLPITLIMLIAMLSTFDAMARDDHLMFSIEKAMSQETAKEKLNQGVKFYFGNQAHKKIEKNFGNVMSNKKTNAVGKSEEHACNWAFLSAMLSFQDNAIRNGANAVVNIRSYYRKNEIVSDTQFECGSGSIMAGVTFTGDVVTLAD